jgi:hypothetical protein
MASVDTELYFDFMDMSDVVSDETEETEQEQGESLNGMSTSVILISWAFLGAITGLVVYFAYGFMVQFTGHDALMGGGTNKKMITEAQLEQEMTSKQARGAGVHINVCFDCYETF